jgi:methionyl-tRNA synthetase
MPTIVTTAPPTPNGDLHLGHLSGPYSGADAFARARRLCGDDAELLIGSDIHQSYMPEKARELGEDVHVVAERFDGRIETLFRRMNFVNRQFVRPQRSELHTRFVQDFFARLWDTGKLETREQSSVYCESCDLHLVDAYLTGTCPHCGNDDCDGNLCERCAWPNSCVDLIDVHCNFCGGTPSRSTLRRLVFPLGRYADELRRYHRHAVLSPQLEALCDELLSAGLPDIPVTQPMPWGVPVTVPGFTDQRYFVWAEMVPGYFATVAESRRLRGLDPEDWRAEWNGSDVVQFFGWDNGYFHALLFPALMAAWDPGLRLPTALLTNEFYQLDALKFSTSRQHAIWGNVFLDAVPADVCRFVLALDRPEFTQTSFSLETFHALANDELAGRWQPWLAGTLERLADLGPADIELSPSHARFVAGLTGLAEECLSHYGPDDFSLGQVARSLIELVTRARDFTATQSRSRASGPETGERLRRSAAAAEGAAARLLAQLAAPIMPEFAGRLWTALGEAGEPILDGIRVPTGAAQVPSTPFFAPIHVTVDEVRPSPVPVP